MDMAVAAGVSDVPYRARKQEESSALLQMVGPIRDLLSTGNQPTSALARTGIHGLASVDVNRVFDGAILEKLDQHRLTNLSHLVRTTPHQLRGLEFTNDEIQSMEKKLIHLGLGLGLVASQISAFSQNPQNQHFRDMFPDFNATSVTRPSSVEATKEETHAQSVPAKPLAALLTAPERREPSASRPAKGERGAMNGYITLHFSSAAERDRVRGRYMASFQKLLTEFPECMNMVSSNADMMENPAVMMERDPKGFPLALTRESIPVVHKLLEDEKYRPVFDAVLKTERNQSAALAR